MLTNFKTIQSRINRLKEIETMEQDLYFRGAAEERGYRSSQRDGQTAEEPGKSKI